MCQINLAVSAYLLVVCTSDLAISLAVLQVIGFVFIPFTTIDSNLSLSVSAGAHVCLCIGDFYVYIYNCSALYVSMSAGMCYILLAVPCFTVLCCVYLCRALDTFSICFPSVSPSPGVSHRPFQLTL